MNSGGLVVVGEEKKGKIKIKEWIDFGMPYSYDLAKCFAVSLVITIKVGLSKQKKLYICL